MFPKVLPWNVIGLFNMKLDTLSTTIEFVALIVAVALVCIGAVPGLTIRCRY